MTLRPPTSLVNMPDNRGMIKEVESDTISSTHSVHYNPPPRFEIILDNNDDDDCQGFSPFFTMMMMITIVIGWLAPIPAHIYILKPSQGLARLILQPAYASRGIYCTSGICIYRNAGIYSFPGGIYGCIHSHSGQYGTHRYKVSWFVSSAHFIILI